MGDSVLRTSRFNAEGSEELEGAVKGRRPDWRKLVDQLVLI